MLKSFWVILLIMEQKHFYFFFIQTTIASHKNLCDFFFVFLRDQ